MVGGSATCGTVTPGEGLHRDGRKTPWPDKPWRRPLTTTTHKGPAQREGDGGDTSNRLLQSMADTHAVDGGRRRRRQEKLRVSFFLRNEM